MRETYCTAGFTSCLCPLRVLAVRKKEIRGTTHQVGRYTPEHQQVSSPFRVTLPNRVTPRGVLERRWHRELYAPGGADRFSTRSSLNLAAICDAASPLQGKDTHANRK